MVDNILRREAKNARIVVIGVAFVDHDRLDKAQAPCLGITEARDSQVVFRGFVGAEGMTLACETAVHHDLPAVETRKNRRVIVRELDAGVTKALATIRNRGLEIRRQANRRRNGGRSK